MSAAHRRDELIAQNNNTESRPNWSGRFPSMLTLEEFRTRYPHNGVLLLGHCIDDLAELWNVPAEAIMRAVRHCGLAALTDVVSGRHASTPTDPRRTVWIDLPTRTLSIREVPVYRDNEVIRLMIFAAAAPHDNI